MIAIRTDADPVVGLGHVQRCLALAGELAPSSEVCFFLKGSETVRDLIRREGFRCDLVSGGFETTLDAVSVAKAAVLVIDSYDVTNAQYEAARSPIRLLVVLDDLGRYPLPADLVVNPGPGVHAPAAENGTHYLLGPRFALLRREFAVPVVRKVREPVRRVLLILGGATPGLLMVALARVARRALPEAMLDLVVGPVGEEASAVVAGLSGLDGVRIHSAPKSVRPLMLEADLAVTGGGVTIFELAASGTPAVGVELAPNQALNLTRMVGAGAVILARKTGERGLAEEVARTLATLASDVGRRLAMSSRGRELVDGRGAARVAEAVRARLE